MIHGEIKSWRPSASVGALVASGALALLTLAACGANSPARTNSSYPNGPVYNQGATCTPAGSVGCHGGTYSAPPPVPGGGGYVEGGAPPVGPGGPPVGPGDGGLPPAGPGGPGGPIGGGQAGGGYGSGYGPGGSLQCSTQNLEHLIANCQLGTDNRLHAIGQAITKLADKYSNFQAGRLYSLTRVKQLRLTKDELKCLQDQLCQAPNDSQTDPCVDNPDDPTCNSNPGDNRSQEGENG